MSAGRLRLCTGLAKPQAAGKRHPPHPPGGSQQMTKNNQTSRRQFLKTSAAAATTTLLVAGGVHAADSDTIKVGVIGCGGRGSGAAENVMNSAPNVQIVAIGDAFKYRVDHLRRQLQNFVKSDEMKKLSNTIDLPEERCFSGLDAAEKVINSDANYIILATPPGFRPGHIQA